MLALSLVLFLLASCGTSAATSTGAAASGRTATPAARNPTLTLPPRATSTPTKVPPVQHCGTVHVTRLLIVPTDQDRAQEIEQCFWQAYQHCRPATLVYSRASLDTVTIHTFALTHHNGTCVISDTLEYVIAPRAGRPGGSAICGGLTRQPAGLYFLACGRAGTILVPAAGAQ